MPTAATYIPKIEAALDRCLNHTNFKSGIKTTGKVRDIYDLGDKLMLITTDRLSAFDRQLALIPFKGQVLNLISAWWFKKTAELVPNHLLAIPDPNVLIAKKCQVFPIEFVVRGYITGTTNTSLWTQYNNGSRSYCGIDLPEGLVKNQRLSEPLLTPTTKDKIHDKPISPEEIIREAFMTEEEWVKASTLALKLYQAGVELAKKHDLILVDTKYEFGRDNSGAIVLIDEVHTPDSSRYWLDSSYQSCFEAGKEPENIDKEFLRLWFAKNCDPYQEADLPLAPRELVIELASRYIQLYEKITQELFPFDENDEPIAERIKRNISLLG